MSIKIKKIPFDGNQDSWHMWSRIFLAKLTVQGGRRILDGTVKVVSDKEILKKGSNVTTE